MPGQLTLSPGDLRDPEVWHAPLRCSAAGVPGGLEELSTENVVT